MLIIFCFNFYLQFRAFSLWIRIQIFRFRIFRRSGTGQKARISLRTKVTICFTFFKFKQKLDLNNFQHKKKKLKFRIRFGFVLMLQLSVLYILLGGFVVYIVGLDLGSVVVGKPGQTCSDSSCVVCEPTRIMLGSLTFRYLATMLPS